MAAKKTKEKVNNLSEKPQPAKRKFFDLLEFGESYTSLILGIVVVIIATILLLTFVRNTNNQVRPQKQTASQQAPKKIAQAALSVSTTPKPTVTTKSPTPTLAKATPTVVKKPTPTIMPKVAAAKDTMVKTENTPKAASYIVARGDTLWKIAEKNYKSGYNWVDIASANNLNAPGVIHTGDKLILPKVEPKIATVSLTPQQTTLISSNTTTPSDPVVTTNKITNGSYTVGKGDTLWNIAVRAYGDGYQWVKIANANNLTNPSMIFSGNTLKIPRA